MSLALWAPSWSGAAVTERQLRNWQETAAEIDGTLKRGEWASAEHAAETLLEQMLRVPQDPSLGSLVSVAVLQRAAAEAGLGKTDDALWSWNAAQNLNPRLRLARFPGYGPAGTFLEGHRLREAGTPSPGVSPVPLAPEMVPPVAPQEIPQPWAAFELVVDEQGAVHAPVLLSPASPRAVLEQMEAIRGLRLEPATAEGRRWAVYWRPRPPLWVLRESGPG